MIRKIATIMAALACAAGLSLVGAGTASATVNPVSGTYNGVDHHGAVVSFSYNGSQLSHFRVGNIYISSVHVSNGQFPETCGGGYCIKGHWLTETHVQGYWKQGGSHEWKSFSASTASFRPYTGTYSGSDHTSLNIHFSYSGGFLRGFTWDHNHIGNAAVDHLGHFSVCHVNFCFKGHWQTEYYVVGEWRHLHEHTWHTWDANAYSA
jgi:hypothetical protein